MKDKVESKNKTWNIKVNATQLKFEGIIYILIASWDLQVNVSAHGSTPSIRLLASLYCW